MFAAANLPELARIARAVITPDVVAGAQVWKVDDKTRHDIRVALFGRAKPVFKTSDPTTRDQNTLLSDFTATVAGPLIAQLPADVGAFAMLMLYEEFVKAVFIQSVLEAEVGGEG